MIGRVQEGLGPQVLCHVDLPFCRTAHNIRNLLPQSPAGKVEGREETREILYTLNPVQYKTLCKQNIGSDLVAIVFVGS